MDIWQKTIFHFFISNIRFCWNVDAYACTILQTLDTIMYRVFIKKKLNLQFWKSLLTFEKCFILQTIYILLEKLKDIFIQYEPWDLIQLWLVLDFSKIECKIKERGSFTRKWKKMEKYYSSRIVFDISHFCCRGLQVVLESRTKKSSIQSMEDFSSLKSIYISCCSFRAANSWSTDESSCMFSYGWRLFMGSVTALISGVLMEDSENGNLTFIF